MKFPPVLQNKVELLSRLHENLLQDCKKKNESYVRREVTHQIKASSWQKAGVEIPEQVQLKAEISRLKKALETTVALFELSATRQFVHDYAQSQAPSHIILCNNRFWGRLATR